MTTTMSISEKIVTSLAVALLVAGFATGVLAKSQLSGWQVAAPDSTVMRVQ